MKNKICSILGSLLLVSALAQAKEPVKAGTVGRCSEVPAPGSPGIILLGGGANPAPALYRYDHNMLLTVVINEKGEPQLAGSLTRGDVQIDYLTYPEQTSVMGGTSVWKGQFASQLDGSYKSEDGVKLNLTKSSSLPQPMGDAIVMPRLDGREDYSANLKLSDGTTVTMSCVLKTAELAKVQKGIDIAKFKTPAIEDTGGLKSAANGATNDDEVTPECGVSRGGTQTSGPRNPFESLGAK